MEWSIRRYVFAACLVCAPALAVAQNVDEFPQRSVRIVVPFPAGGTADILPRIISDKLSQNWGQSVVVDNRTGAGGNIGAAAVAEAQPDGYTLLSSPPGPLAVNHNLYKELSYDPTRFKPITVLAKAPNVVAIRKDLPVKDIQEFIEYTRENSGKVTVATQGNGSTSHLTGAMFASAVDTEFTFVPYRGSAPALAALVGGQVDVFFDNIGAMYAQHASDNARIIAVASPTRSPLLPDVPTLAESGLDGFESVTWFGMVAPPETPDELVNKINRDVVQVLKLPEVQKRFEDHGVEAVGDSPAETAAFMDRERERWKKVIDTNDVVIN